MVKKKNQYWESIKSISQGYLITLFIALGTIIVNFVIYLATKWAENLTKGAVEISPSWFIQGISVIGGFFALLTLFTVLTWQFIGLIKIIKKSI